MSAEELADRAAHAKAVKVMGGHKAQITRASVCLKKVVEEGVIGEGDEATVKSARSMVEKQMVKIESQVDDLLGNDNFTEDALNEITDYLLDKGNLCETVTTILNEKFAVKTEPAILDTSGIGAALSESLAQVQIRQPLTAADLPYFNGEASEFIPFLESFNFLVHENDGIPDAMKATYLKRCMKERGKDGKSNSAYDLLKHITPTKENYRIMRDKLEKRFKLGYVNRATYLANLRKLNSWTPCHTGLEIRKLYDYIMENLDLLELAGGNPVKESDILLTDVLSLIPKFMVNAFLDLAENDRTLDRLLVIIDESVSRMLERDVLVPRTTKPQYNKPVPTNRYNNNSRPAQIYQATAKCACIFCGKEHSAYTCNTGNVHARLATAKDRRFCHNCLYGGHFSADCRLASNCSCGKGKHCRALCLHNNQHDNSYPQPNSQGGGRGFGGQRGGRGRGQSIGRGQSMGRGGGYSTQGSGNNNINSLVAVDLARLNSAIADTECFMEIGRGFVQTKLGSYIPARFLFDTASNGSYARKDLVHEVICDKVGKRNIEIDTFGEGEVNCQNCDIVRLTVEDLNHFYEPTEIYVSVVNHLCKDIPTWQLTPHQSKSIRNYQLSEPEQISGKRVPIDVLIGLDNYWKFVHRRTDDPGFGPMIRSSKLGWFLSGPRDFSNPRLLTTKSNNPLTRSVQTMFANVIEVSPDLSDKLELESLLFANKAPQSEEEQYCSRFSDLETFGIKPEQEVSPILEEFNNGISFNEETKRFNVCLPFVGRLKSKLEDNYSLSKTRLNSLFDHKIRKPEHAEFAKKYYEIINDQERLGVIERVTDMTGDTTSNVHYIPHHGVFKDGSDKLRIVYDGSSTSGDAISLNDCLSPGPSLTNELIEMLMRFRTHDVVLTGDIEKAFLQIEVAEADRDYLRFLWYDHDGKLVVYRFARVPFGLRCSSFLLNATLRYHMQKRCLENDNPDLLQLLSKSHYVDDWLMGAKTPEKALLIKSYLTEFLEAIGMKLHKCNSNSEVVRQSLEADCPEGDSVLGLNWDASTDEVSIKVERALMKMSKELTKCELYSAPPRVFDPLGFFQPFMFHAKLLFQEVCKSKIKWKAKLPPDVEERFETWKGQLHKLIEVKLPRHVVLPDYNTVELHGFGDASKLGYCACIYIVSQNSSHKVSRLIVSKTRVSPLKEMSIPRLELTAAFLLARLMALVIKFHDNLKFDRLVYYSDSTTVLHWIQSNHKQWTTYVANRVRDINLLSSPEDWKYVRTELNPADLGTRGIGADELVGNDFWFHGPTFLVSGQNDKTSTLTPDITHPTADSLTEHRKIVKVMIERVAEVEKLLPPRKDGSKRKLEDYSSIDKVLNVTSYLYRYIHMKMGEQRFAKWLGHEPDSSFRKIAEERWVRAVQADHFAKEVNFCRNHPKVIPSGMKVASSKVQQLGLFLDGHGVLRVNTLLHHASIAEDAKEPMLLPKHSHFTSTIVWRAHIRLKHAGVAQTLAEIRQAYWIPQGRQMIRNILRQCVKCRMALATPYPVLAQPQLPDFRVQRVEVFSSTGVDFAGPLYIKAALSEKLKKRKEERKKGKKKEEVIWSERMVYLVIFTCAVSRNVHAEVLDGMTVADFMHGLRRFISKYGPPSLFYSDNAKTFECVSRELKQVLGNPKLHKYLHDREITWKFYVQKAPWMGGFIERVVGLFKSAVRRVVGRAMLDFQEFLTLIYEINAVLNSRPISYVYDTVGEEDPITPSKLWCGKNVTLFPPLYEARIERKDPEICKKRLKYVDKLLSHFWQRFTSQYLSSLSERHLSRNLPRDGRQPKVGEVVLIKNDLLPRGRWKIARVIKVTPGPDGVVRRVELQPPYHNLTPDTKKNKPSEVINRPPRLLVPLECEVDNTNPVNVEQEDTNG